MLVITSIKRIDVFYPTTTMMYAIPLQGDQGTSAMLLSVLFLVVCTLLIIIVSDQVPVSAQQSLYNHYQKFDSTYQQYVLHAQEIRDNQNGKAYMLWKKIEGAFIQIDTALEDTKVGEQRGLTGKAGAQLNE